MSKLIVIMGVSGCGKTSVGIALADCMSLPFYDADDYHPTDNIKKMQAGIPLEDRDRITWLERLNCLCKGHLESGLVLACSALKQSYRDVLSKEVQIKWVYIKGSFELISKRLAARTDHFMPVSLLQSQFDTLEEPIAAIEITVDQSIESMVSQLKDQL